MSSETSILGQYIYWKFNTPNPAVRGIVILFVVDSVLAYTVYPMNLIFFNLFIFGKG